MGKISHILMWPAKKPLQSGFGNPFGIWKDHRNLDKKKSVKKTSKLASPLQNEQPIKSGSNVQKEKKQKQHWLQEKEYVLLSWF